jgi:hypothetical protein
MIPQPVWLHPTNDYHDNDGIEVVDADVVDCTGGGDEVVLKDTDATTTTTTTTIDDNWEFQYQEYLNYTQTTGNHHVPLHHPTLGKWIRMQRMHYKQWQQGQMGSLVVPCNGTVSDTPTAMTTTTRATSTTTISSISSSTTTKTPTSIQQQTRLERLLQAGFIFQVQDYEWMKQYQALQTYRDIHGHCRVPSSRNSSAITTPAANMAFTHSTWIQQHQQYQHHHHHHWDYGLRINECSTNEVSYLKIVLTC